MSGHPSAFWTDPNRRFGLIVAGGFGGIAGVRFIVAGTVTWWLVIPAGACLVAALLAPASLGPLRAAWMRLAAVLGYVNERLLLTLLFVGLIVPTALLLRLLGWQPIRLQFRDGAVSYWRRRRAEEFTAERMERQF